MDPSQWIVAFRALHERVKKGEADPEERQRHLGMREEFARSLVSAQGLVMPPGQNARKHFRVAQVFNLEVNNLYRAVTRDVSRSGFSALIPGAFKEGEQVSFGLVLVKGQEPVTGQARVVSAVKLQGSSRVSFIITSMEEALGERLEMALFDAALSRIK